MSDKVLLADLSDGALLRLALAEPGQRPVQSRLYTCSSADDFEAAVAAFVELQGNSKLMGAAISASGWDIGGRIDLVHYGFTLERERVCAAVGTRNVNLVNNVVARALAIPILRPDERRHICGKPGRPDEVIAVVGLAQGLGGAALAPDGQGGWIATHCEGGHADFAPRTSLEIEILRLLMLKHGHVSRETAVSAPGLSELWACLSRLEGGPEPQMTAEAVLVRAREGDERALRAVRVQTELYAGVAADVALMTGARGGVYLSGRHLDALGELFDADVFAGRFYDKGRVSSWMRGIPVYRITAEAPEIAGISTLFEGE